MKHQLELIMHKHTHQVTYVIAEEDQILQYFHCTADDFDHAEEQCMDAYPNCVIIAISNHV